MVVDAVIFAIESEHPCALEPVVLGSVDEEVDGLVTHHIQQSAARDSYSRPDVEVLPDEEVERKMDSPDNRNEGGFEQVIVLHRIVFRDVEVLIRATLAVMHDR